MSGYSCTVSEGSAIVSTTVLALNMLLSPYCLVSFFSICRHCCFTHFLCYSWGRDFSYIKEGEQGLGYSPIS